MGVKKTGRGRRKLGQKKRRMRARIRHRKGWAAGRRPARTSAGAGAAVLRLHRSDARTVTSSRATRRFSGPGRLKSLRRPRRGV